MEIFLLKVNIPHKRATSTSLSGIPCLLFLKTNQPYFGMVYSAPLHMMYSILRIYSGTEGHSDFKFLPIMNTALCIIARWILLGHNFSKLSFKQLWRCDHRVLRCDLFWKNPTKLSSEGAVGALHQQWRMVPVVPRPPEIGGVIILEFSICNRCAVPCGCFNLYFLMVFNLDVVL